MNIGTMWAQLGLDYSPLVKGVKESEAVMKGLDPTIHNMAKGLSVAALGYASLASVAAASMYAVVQSVKFGIDAVDNYQLSIVKTASMLSSMKTTGGMAENYRLAKQYAEGLEPVLQQMDAQTTLNLQNLEAINEEMIKQGIQ